ALLERGRDRAQMTGLLGSTGRGLGMLVEIERSRVLLLRLRRDGVAAYVQVECREFLAVGGDVFVQCTAHLIEVGNLLLPLAPAIDQEATATGGEQDAEWQVARTPRTFRAVVAGGTGATGGEVLGPVDELDDERLDVAITVAAGGLRGSLQGAPREAHVLGCADADAVRQDDQVAAVLPGGIAEVSRAARPCGLRQDGHPDGRVGV